MQIIDQHPVGFMFAGYIVVNSVAAGMPMPEPGSGIAYRWAHGSLNALALNIETLMRARNNRLAQLSPGIDGQNAAGNPG